MPSAGSASTSSRLALTMFSMLPARSKCTAPTKVTTPTFGWVRSHNVAISPVVYMPISSTAFSSLSCKSNRARGSPKMLLRLPGDLKVRYLLDRTAWVSSLVEVLPTLPVMPITSAGKRARHALADVCKAAMVSSTNRQTGVDALKGAAGGSAVRKSMVAYSSEIGRSTNAAIAPCSNAAATKSCPSTFSPL